MPPATGYDPIGTVQQAIVSLLNTQEPIFLALGTRLFMSFAVLLLTWYGIRWMFGGDNTVVRAFGFAKLLVMISFRYAMIVFYEAPITLSILEARPTSCKALRFRFVHALRRR